MSTPSSRAPSDLRPPRSTDVAPLGTPLFLLNLKSYPGALGPGAERIGRVLERLGQEFAVPVALAPAAPDIAHLSQLLQIPVLAQHTDDIDSGAHTGYVVAEALSFARAQGSLLNHSERPISAAAVRTTMERLRHFGLVPVVCARNVAEARTLARFRPPYLAVEPPELIGGNVSVSKAKPEVISRTVTAVRAVSPSTKVLCGAGIHDATDVRRSVELGSEGILVASAVTRASDVEEAIRELLRGFRPDPAATAGMDSEQPPPSSS
ncbi:MAG: triose-phosphate isomerase [Thermoplasmata archaeon]